MFSVTIMEKMRTVSILILKKTILTIIMFDLEKVHMHSKCGVKSTSKQATLI